MSGQTVTGKTLQFTDDNKRCFAYSGKVEVGNTATTLLKFETNSSYIIAKYQPQFMDDGTLTHNVRTDITFNEELISQNEVTSSLDYTPYDELHLIIPPHTRVLITALILTAAGPYGFGGILTGKVGMPQRVGNLND